MQEKVCTKCKNTLSIHEYHKDRKGKDGLRSWCKSCEKIRNKLSSTDRFAVHKNAKSIVYYNGRAAKLRSRADGSITGEQLKVLMEICNHKCSYCKSPDDLQFDHIVSVEEGGSSDLENLTVLCAKCNRLKGKMSHKDFIALLKIIIANSEQVIPSEALS